MDIKYNTNKIKSIISDFANLTGINIALMDCNYNCIAKYEYNKPEFCHKIQSYESGMQLCRLSDIDMVKKCTQTGGFVSHTCHAGIIDSAMPIKKDNMIIGYVIFGRVRPSADIMDIYPNISWTGESPENLTESYMKITHYNSSQMKSLANLVSTIILSDAVTVELSEPLRKATLYISQNLNKDLSIKTLCKISHVSKNVLYKSFNDAFKTTVSGYITSKRIEYAKSLLKNTDKKIFEISEKVGLVSPAHFCRMFKKNTGISPSEYRARPF